MQWQVKYIQISKPTHKHVHKHSDDKTNVHIQKTKSHKLTSTCRVKSRRPHGTKSHRIIIYGHIHSKVKFMLIRDHKYNLRGSVSTKSELGLGTFSQTPWSGRMAAWTATPQHWGRNTTGTTPKHKIKEIKDWTGKGFMSIYVKPNISLHCPVLTLVRWLFKSFALAIFSHSNSLDQESPVNLGLDLPSLPPYLTCPMEHYKDTTLPTHRRAVNTIQINILILGEFRDPPAFALGNRVKFLTSAAGLWTQHTPALGFCSPIIIVPG